MRPSSIASLSQTRSQDSRLRTNHAQRRPSGDELPQADASAVPDFRQNCAARRGTAVANPRSVEDPRPPRAQPVSPAKPAAAAAAGEFPWPRVGNTVLGLWLQISAFAWPHTDGARLSAWLPGLLISIIALLSMGAPPMRWLNSVLALFLIAWTAVSASNEALTYWNSVACGLAILVLSTIPTRSLATDFQD